MPRWLEGNDVLATLTDVRLPVLDPVTGHLLPEVYTLLADGFVTVEV